MEIKTLFANSGPKVHGSLVVSFPDHTRKREGVWQHYNTVSAQTVQCTVCVCVCTCVRVCVRACVRVSWVGRGRVGMAEGYKLILGGGILLYLLFPQTVTPRQVEEVTNGKHCFPRPSSPNQLTGNCFSLKVIYSLWMISMYYKYPCSHPVHICDYIAQ